VLLHMLLRARPSPPRPAAPPTPPHGRASLAHSFTPLLCACGGADAASTSHRPVLMKCRINQDGVAGEAHALPTLPPTHRLLTSPAACQPTLAPARANNSLWMTVLGPFLSADEERRPRNAHETGLTRTPTLATCTTHAARTDMRLCWTGHPNPMRSHLTVGAGSHAYPTPLYRACPVTTDL
jgi:hypothetical protein